MPVQQIGEFKINNVLVPFPVRPYVWTPPPVLDYTLSGLPLRQGKWSCTWQFLNATKDVLDFLYGFLPSRTFDTKVTIRTLDPRQPGYSYANFTAVMHLPTERYERALLQSFSVLFTSLEPV